MNKIIYFKKNIFSHIYLKHLKMNKNTYTPFFTHATKIRN